MSDPVRLIVVDDERTQLDAFCSVLTGHGYSVTGFDHPEKALVYVSEQGCDLLLTDLKLPGMTGIDLISALLARDASLTSILMTGHSSVETAIEALKLGVQDYVLKPFKFSEIQPVIEKALKFRRLRLENDALLKRVTTANQKLTELNSELDTFAGRVAHDLNSIVHLIQGYSGSLLTRDANNFTDMEWKYLNRIHDTSLRGGQLVSDLLAFARLGTGELKLAEIRLADVVHRAKVMTQLEHDGPSAEWVIGELPELLGDDSLLEQVFCNLFSNALKYSSKQERPRIEVSCQEFSDGFEVMVKDNGAGFDPAQASRLFKPFQRLHTEQEFQGHGMGLANVKRIIERHQGQVRAFSAPGEGATFVLNLPKPHEIHRRVEESASPPMLLESKPQDTELADTHKPALSTVDRINSMLNAQNQVNVLIPSMRSTQDMFDEVCRRAPSIGQIPLVCVVQLAENSQQFKVVAKGGVHQDLADIAVQFINPIDHAALLNSLQQRQIYVCQDVRTGTLSQGWKMEAISRGLESFAIIPLHLQNHLYAAMVYFGNGTHYFDASVIELLETISKNRSLALDNLVHHLQKSETLERLQLLETCVERLNDMVLITKAEPIDGDGPEILYANPACYRRTGYQPHEVIGNTPRILHGPQTQRDVLDRIRASAEQWLPVRDELILYTKSGEQFWVEIDIVPVANEVGFYTHWVAIQRDITERKAAQQELESHLNRFQCLANATSDCVWDWNIQTGEHIWWNEGLVKLFGYKPEDIGETMESWKSRVHPDDIGRVMAGVDELAQTRENYWTDKYRFARADGTWADVVDRGYIVRDEQGCAIRMTGGITDVSHLLEMTRQSESQLLKMNLLNKITQAIGRRSDIDHIYSVVVSALEKELPSDFCFMGAYDHVKQTVAIKSFSEITRVMAGSIGVNELTQFDLSGTHLEVACAGEFVYQEQMAESFCPIARDVHSKLHLNSMVIVPLKKGDDVVGVMVTARYRGAAYSADEREFLRQLGEHVSLALAQAELLGQLKNAYEELTQTQDLVLQQERLRALAEMAGGIAHDINNAISPAALYTEALLMTEKTLSEKGRGQLKTVQLAIDDVARTVERMGRFAKGREDVGGYHSTDLNRLCMEVIELTRARWETIPFKNGIHISMKTCLSQQAVHLNASESELREALTNLIFNAVDALPNGGQIELVTLIEQGETGPVACVKVVDNGVGMSEDNARRCLEPFFTTKGERGTGLGLSMVYGIVKRVGGQLLVSSEEGSGTSIEIKIQMGERQSLLNHAAKVALNSTNQRSKSVLLVDDDESVLSALNTVLSDAGHHVLAVNSAMGALAALHDRVQANESFDLVITDLGMPDMNGHELAKRIKAVSERIPVILLTGWGSQMTLQEEEVAWVEMVLSKPPKKEEILEYLHAL